MVGGQWTGRVPGQPRRQGAVATATSRARVSRAQIGSRTGAPDQTRGSFPAHGARGIVPAAGERPGWPPAGAGRAARRGCGPDACGHARGGHGSEVRLLLPGHVRPDKPGQLAGHRNDRDFVGLAACGQGLGLAVQPMLRLQEIAPGCAGRLVLAAGPNRGRNGSAQPPR